VIKAGDTDKWITARKQEVDLSKNFKAIGCR